MRVSAIAGSKHAGHIRARAVAFDLDESFGIQLQIISEQLGVRLMADSQEEAVDGYMPLFLVRQTFLVNQVCALNLRFAGQPQRVMLEQHLYLRVVKHALLHYLRCTEVRLTNNHIHLLAQIGQIGRLLAGSVTASYNSHGLAAIEEAVAGCARTHTASSILRFTRYAQPLG